MTFPLGLSVSQVFGQLNFSFDIYKRQITGFLAWWAHLTDTINSAVTRSTDICMKKQGEEDVYGRIQIGIRTPLPAAAAATVVVLIVAVNYTDTIVSYIIRCQVLCNSQTIISLK